MTLTRLDFHTAHALQELGVLFRGSTSLKIEEKSLSFQIATVVPVKLETVGGVRVKSAKTDTRRQASYVFVCDICVGG